MKIDRSIQRKRLDDRLVGLKLQVGPRPDLGWVRAVRDALGMSTSELGERMGISQSRASQIERSETSGVIQLSTLQRAAAALNCDLVYCFEPRESLDETVWRRALLKAARTLGLVEALSATDDPGFEEEVRFERIEGLAYSLVNRRGLWRGDPPQPVANAGPDPPGPPAS